MTLLMFHLVFCFHYVVKKVSLGSGCGSGGGGGGGGGPQCGGGVTLRDL